MLASTAAAISAFAGLSGRLLAMDGLASGLVVAVDGLGRQFWPASSLHGLTSLFFAVDGLGQLMPLACSLHGLISDFLPL